MTIIVVDAMGGDYAPHQIVEGAVEAACEHDIDVLLVGQSDAIRAELDRCKFDGSNIHIHQAEETISMGEDPVRAIRRKPNSSIVVGLNMVRNGKADAFVSGGSTGAVTAAALLILGRKKHISRPALGVTFETSAGSTLLLDVGANSDCKPQNLVQFANMGHIYMQRIFGIPKPRIGLLSSGEETTKGNKLARSTYPLLAKSEMNFIGNVEGQDIPKGGVDVIVTDGFTGNVVIKLSEGLGEVLSELSRQSNSEGPVLKEAKRRVLNHTAGALLLGVSGNVIITHGKSDALAIKQTIGVAEQMTKQGVLEAIGH